MDRNEIIRKYCALESELEILASSLGKSVAELTKSFHSQPDSVKDVMRPILWEQLECLQVMQGWHYQEYSNVSVFPVTRRQ